ncbi:MAG: hypothetical protein Q9157_004333 [Trypethelium eluteriae]
MGAKGIFTIAESQPCPALAEVVERLKREFDPVQVGRWNFDIRQFRSTTSSTDGASRGAPAAPSFLQILSQPTRAGPLEVTVTTTVEAQSQTTISIPPDQVEGFLQLVASKLGGLWAPRPTLQVSGGSVYDLGEFFVRVGELRQAGSQVASRGLIVLIEEADQASSDENVSGGSISLAGPATRDENRVDGDVTAARDTLRNVWDSLQMEGAKEFIRAGPRDPGATRFDEAQLCCEALRLRS